MNNRQKETWRKIFSLRTATFRKSRYNEILLFRMLQFHINCYARYMYIHIHIQGGW